MFKKIGEVTSKASNGYSVIDLIAGGSINLEAGNIGDVCVYDDARKIYIVVSKEKWEQIKGVEEIAPIDPTIALRESISELEAKVQELETKKQDLETQVQALRDANQELKAAELGLENEKQSLETQVQELNNEKQELQNQITLKDGDIATLNNEKQELQTALDEMRNERDRLQSELSNQLIKNANAQAQIDELKGEAQIDAVALKSENDSLKAQLDSKTQLAEEQRIELETLKNASVPSSENALEP